MKERGINFSGAMVRALLDGTKTQTRRVVKMPKAWDCIVYADWGNGWWPYRSDDGESPNYDNNEIPLNCPYGQPGARLWVRETWVHIDDEGDKVDGMGSQTYYRASSQDPERDDAWLKERGLRWKASIYMPRALSRIQLEITDVRVEQLHNISEADAIAEGIEQMPCAVPNTRLWRNYDPSNGWTPKVAIPQNSYRSLWESINGAASWDANPWVWVVDFKRVTL